VSFGPLTEFEILPPLCAEGTVWHEFYQGNPLFLPSAINRGASASLRRELWRASRGLSLCCLLIRQTTPSARPFSLIDAGPGFLPTC
jgi:hypothetical protein